MKRDWKKVRKEVKEFVENEVYPAEEILQKRLFEKKNVEIIWIGICKFTWTLNKMKLFFPQ